MSTAGAVSTAGLVSTTGVVSTAGVVSIADEAPESVGAIAVSTSDASVGGGAASSLGKIPWPS